MQDHRRLLVYRVVREPALEVYVVVRMLPPEERFDLARQLWRGCPGRLEDRRGLRSFNTS